MGVAKKALNPFGALQPLENALFNGGKPKDLLNPVNIIDAGKTHLMRPDSVLKGDSSELKTVKQDKVDATNKERERTKVWNNITGKYDYKQ